MKRALLTFFVVSLIASSLDAQSLPWVVKRVNGAMNATIDSVKMELKKENKKLNEEQFGEWVLYDEFGTFTFITDVSNEYVVEVFFIPYKDDWFEMQDYTKYALSEDDIGDVQEWAEDVRMYKDDQTEVWFGDVTTMEGERRIAIW